MVLLSRLPVLLDNLCSDLLTLCLKQISTLWKKSTRFEMVDLSKALLKLHSVECISFLFIISFIIHTAISRG